MKAPCRSTKNKLLIFGAILLLMGNSTNAQDWEPSNLKEGCTAELYIDTIVIKNYDYAPPWTLTYGGTQADPTGWLHIDEDPFPPTRDTCIITGYAGSPGLYSFRITVENTTSTPPFASRIYELRIHPKPVVLAGQTKTICSGDHVDFEILLSPNNLPAGSVFSWAAPAMSDGSAQGSAGNNVPAGPAGTRHINDILENNTSAPITATYTITPLVGYNCTGTPENVVITIDPKPVLADLDHTVCSGEVTGITLATVSSSIPASSFNIISISSGGLTATAGNPVTGNGKPADEIQDDIWENASNTAIDVIYKVSPVAGNGCIGDEKDITVTVNPAKDFDVMLVLDVSGSMGDPCPGCEVSKLRELKKAVQAFMDPLLVNYFRLDRDRMGVVFFQSVIDESGASPVYIHNQPQLDNLYNSVIDPQTAHGATAMGGGLQTGIDSLLENNDLGNSQNIILVTDGMQNRNPMIVHEPDEIRIKDIDVSLPGPPYGGSDVDPHPLPMEINDELGVRIFSIGINATGNYADLLIKLADSTNGEHNIEPADDALKFDQFFTQSFVDMMRGCSPQLVDYRYGSLSNGTKTEVFKVEEGVTNVLLKLSGKTTDGPDLRFSVRKDGEDLTRIGEISDKDHYRIFSIDLPVVTGGKTIQAAGNWEMVISGKTEMDYRACAIVNHSPLQYQSTINWQNNIAGNPFELSVSLFDHLGQPIDDARVTANIYKPSRKWDRVLSNASVARMSRCRLAVLKNDLNYLSNLSKTDTVLADFPDHAARKRQLLLQSRKFARYFQPQKVSVALQNQGMGRYSFEFSDTKKTGIYNVDFRIEGSRKDLGEYRRSETRTGMIHFGKPDLHRSKLRLIPPRTDLDVPMRLYIRPRDEFGNLLGPGFAPDLKMIYGGSVRMPVDHLDGSYTFPVTGSIKGRNDTIKLILGQHVIYEGTLNELKSGLFCLIRKKLVYPQGMIERNTLK